MVDGVGAPALRADPSTAPDGDSGAVVASTVTGNVALQRAQRARTPPAGMRDGSTRNVV
jgi:hypothetical protein